VLADTPLADHAGPVRFTRRFGSPGRIDPDERVWLLIEGLASTANVILNDADLDSASGAAEFEITSLLLPRNEVIVHFPVSPGQGPPWDEVYLEVRRTAYLHDVQVRIEGGNVHALGQVVGYSAGPLDLYLVADRVPAAYISLTPLESGQPFKLCGPGGAGPVLEVRVELVQGSVVWYAARYEVTRGQGA
jgi:hypothetical protein